MQDRQTILTYTEYPLALWIVGAFIAIPGIVIYVITPYGSIFLPALELIIASLFFLFPRILTVTVDLGEQTLTLRYRSLLRSSEKQLRIPDIDSIHLETSRDSESGTTYRIVAACKDGQIFPFRSYYSSGRLTKQKKVDRLRTFLGLNASDASQPSNITADFLSPGESVMAATVGEEHLTDGIHWTLQNVTAAGSAALRWFSPDFKFTTGFLFLAQKVPGQKAIGGKLAEGIGKLLFPQVIRLFGFAPEELPGLDSAEMLAPLDSRSEPYFMAYTSDLASARQVLNPWVSTPLAEWAERSPLKTIQVQADFGQLIVLFSPRGVYLSHMGATSAEAVQVLSDLGVAVLKAVQ